jgi:flagellar basal body-associated protein FliL
MKIMKILKTVGMVVAGLVLALTVFLNLFMAYIMIAPDDLPKPFHLTYSYSDGQSTTAENPSPSSAEAVHNVEPAAQPVVHTEPVTQPTSSGPLLVEVKPGEGFMVETGTKIVNLADQTGRKYVRATVVLEFAPPDLEYYSMEGEEKTAYKETFDEHIAAKQPVIDDVIVTLLSQKSYESIYTAEGKEALRLEILQNVSTRLPEYKIISVYFTEFVVQ